jgi:hypothetical protein
MHPIKTPTVAQTPTIPGISALSIQKRGAELMPRATKHVRMAITVERIWVGVDRPLRHPPKPIGDSGKGGDETEHADCPEHLVGTQVLPAALPCDGI